MTNPDARATQPESGHTSRILTALGRFENGRLAQLVRRHRTLFFSLFFGGMSVVSVTAAFLIRFELAGLDSSLFDWSPLWLPLVLTTVPLRLLGFRIFGRHRASWRYASLEDVPPLIGSIAASSAAVVAVWSLMLQERMAGPVLALDTLLYLAMVLVGRYAYRLLAMSWGTPGAKSTRVLVVGGGAAGNLAVEAMLTPILSHYHPVAIVDDDPLKRGMTIHGVEVAGQVAEIVDVARRSRAQAIVLALPSATTAQTYRVAKLCRETGLPLKTVPDIWQILSSNNRIDAVRDFDIDELLHRRTMRKLAPEVNRMLEGRTVLVTGAAGSIGSELCRQIADANAARLVCMDKDENGLFRIEQELIRRARTTELAFFLADIKDESRVEELFVRLRPEIVFHAAAYKHVPILQHHPVEAVRNNVGGTLNLVKAAKRHRVRRFVMISTDKAVNPTSVMGATKQVAEKVVLANSDDGSGSRFTTIRFGNVLGSNGSVVETFRDQIRRGVPVTVTHPEMERFFMTIAEAVRLVLFAATMGGGGDVFVLDMGEPVKIDDLARQMITLSGLTPDVDVPVVYTGLRPGEKLYEELWAEGEAPRPTGTPGIMVASRIAGGDRELGERVGRLLAVAGHNDPESTWMYLMDIVDGFQGRRGADSVLPPDADKLKRPVRGIKAAAAKVGSVGRIITPNWMKSYCVNCAETPENCAATAVLSETVTASIGIGGPNGLE